MVPVEKLKQLKIFKESTEASLEKLAQDMTLSVYKKGDVICREGDEGHTMYLIASGTVAVQKKLSDQETATKTVAKLDAGEFFGEMSFLEEAPLSATVVAESEETEILALPRASLDSVMKKEPEAALNHVVTLMSGLSSRLRRTTSEAVAVFEVARYVGSGAGIQDLVKNVVAVMQSNFDSHTTLAFYRWNPFNDEYMVLQVEGISKDEFPATIDKNDPLGKLAGQSLVSIPNLAETKEDVRPLAFLNGHLLVSAMALPDSPEGMCLVYHSQAKAFDNGQKQLLETTTAVLTPAFVTIRNREEEEARIKLQRSKQARNF